VGSSDTTILFCFLPGGGLKKRLIVGTNLFQGIGFYCGNIKTIQGGGANRHPQRVTGIEFNSGNREQIVFNG
jgi:hypothetical protein